MYLILIFTKDYFTVIAFISRLFLSSLFTLKESFSVITQNKEAEANQIIYTFKQQCPKQIEIEFNKIVEF